MSVPSWGPLTTGEIRLPGSRVLAWTCVGAVEDPPVLWLHGSTGSRRTAPGADGVRMISYDRPGYGGSTAHPGRSLQTDAQDVRALLDALAVACTAVLAFSGGAAVGYACAARLPARVRRLGIVSGAVWPTRPAPSREVLHGAAARLHADPAAAVAGLSIGAAADDRRVLADPAVLRALRDGAEDAVRAGPEGWVTEARLVHGPWPFLPQDIAAPVLLWHGMADRAVPLEQVLPVVAQLRRARLHRLPDAGHVGWLAHEAAILAAVTAPDGDEG